MKNEFIKKRLFVKYMNGKVLDEALTIRLAFLIIPSRYPLKLSLLSILTPSSFSQMLFSLFIFKFPKWTSSSQLVAISRVKL